jgi:hypothetical protein
MLLLFFMKTEILYLITTSASELFGIITEMTNGTKWKVEYNKQFVKIGKKEDSYSIMWLSI